MIADVRLLPCVLADVHLEMGKLQVALGAAGVEADKGLSLLFGLGGVCLLPNQDVRLLLLHVLSWLGDYEGWVGRHGHLQWRSSLVPVSVSGDSVWESNVQRVCRGLGGRVGSHLGMETLLGVGESKGGVTIARRAIANSGRKRRERSVVLQRKCAGRNEVVVAHWCTHGSWEVGELLCGLLRLLCNHAFLGLEAVRMGRGGGRVDRVVGTEFVIGEGRARVHGCWVRRRGELFVLQRQTSLVGEELRTGVVHDSSVRRHCERRADGRRED